MINSSDVTLGQTKVEVRISTGEKLSWSPGIIVGRTIETDPKFDVRLPDGAIAADVPQSHLRLAS